MGVITYLTNAIIPFTIIIIIIYGINEKIKIFDTFIEGAKEGLEIVINLFPTLIGLFVAIGALRQSGVIDAIVNLMNPITSALNIPKEILPLAFLRPISRKCINCYRE